MLIDQITGVSEKLGIVINSPLQGLLIVANKPMSAETIEIQLIDLPKGTQTDIIREEKIELLGEFASMGGGCSTSYMMGIEIAEKGSLYLSGDRNLRINLKNLTAGVTYKIYADKSEFESNTVAEYKQLIIGSGLLKQEFPTMDGEHLILPKTNLQDIRMVFTDGTEVIKTAEELTADHMKANEYGYFIHTTADEVTTTVQKGSMNIFVRDLETEMYGQVKRISKVEINLSANPTSYKFYKVYGIEHIGFDVRR